MTPPPGWYRDPHAPHLERWWDGTAWTEHRRAPGPAAGPVPPSPGGAGGRAGAVALTTAGAVLVAAIVTGAVFLGGDDDGPRAGAGPTAATSVPAPRTPSPSASPSEDPGVVVDQLNGITFPLLDGWVRPENVVEEDAVMTTEGTYDCPGDGTVCRHGLVISRTVTESDETSPELLAEEDIAEAADEAFHEDATGRRPYGGIESHRVVGAGPVAVAGRAGYFVRWRVTTAEGPGGYVQSLVFPSSVGTESPVVVRYVFDAGEDGPPLADMDRITEGIRSLTDADSGGGVGSSIGPAD
ncbi:DUF2510 domain-containing protein [Streptomyces sp. Tu 3180]|uniref:DUF2510 domain-containing protein n=1 Tax=Streptomyces sp. Tu 3180 TaxID=2682611 RepID=UPI001358E743|nr:DUF2510 domain-containing protein [Streptomyces sp. Tu 3180]KAF3469539.1 DUF2510 domain-containing protein [Streptomyces sp. Tu 3180]